MQTTTNDTATRVYARPEARLRITDHIAKVNKRLAAVHSEQAPLAAEFSTETITGESGETFEVLAIDLTWTVAAAGWTLAGVVTPTEDRTDFTYTAVTLEREEIEVADMQWCDHCQTRRKRARVFIITNDEGQRMQVGSTCLTPHTGLTATTGVLNLLASSPEALLGGDVSTEAPTADMASRLGAAPQWETDHLVGKALAAYPQWAASKEKARGWSLAEYVEECVLMTSEQAAKAAEEHAAEIAQIRVHAATQAADNGYWDNVAVALNSTLTGRRHLCLVLSAVSSWHRDQEQAAERAAEKAQTVQEPWAAEGTKIKDRPVEVTLARIAQFETHYTFSGEIQSIYTFRTEEGHLLVWKTQKFLDDAQGNPLEAGARLRLTGGTVKAADTFRGDVQTPITRVQFEVLAAE